MKDSYLYFIIHNLKGMILTCNQPKEQGHKVDQESEFQEERL